MGSTVDTLATERRLVNRAATEPAAFAAVYDDYFPRIYNYVRYRVQDPDSADDITAQVFEQALTNIRSYSPERAPFAVWLFGIARNAVGSHYRAQRRRRWLSLDALRGRPSSSPTPDETVIQKEMQAELLEALGHLTDRQRDLIALRFAAGLTNRRIAELSGLSESNVGVILYRAVRRLRTELGSRR